MYKNRFVWYFHNQAIFLMEESFTYKKNSIQNYQMCQYFDVYA